MTTTHRSSLDPLTGAFTRAVFQRRLARELKRAQRLGAPLALALIDLDHFKSINDAFGHSRGDQVLAAFVQRVAAVLRSGDQLFRYGGDEFVLLLPNTDRPRALAAAERVLEAIAAQPIAGEPPLALSLSIGLAALPEDGLAAEALFERADQRLYQAKRQGRHRVVAAEAEPVPSAQEAGQRLLERERGLQGLHEFLESWPAARRGVLAVTGPRGAGVGRFLAEAAEAARLLGYSVLELAGSPARKLRLFGALSEAHLVPEAPLAPPAGREAPEQEAALPARLRQALLQRAQPGLVIVVSRLLDLDPGTLDFLQAVWKAEDLPQVALIYSGHDAALPPGRSFEAPLQAQVELAGLSPAGVRVWLRGRLQWEAPDELCAWLHTQTGGLPGLLRRAVAYLIEQGGLRAVGESWAADPNLATLPLRERLDQLLDPPTNLALAGPVFIGRQAELRALKLRLAQAPERLVVVVGPGGSGKSRLALQAAAELRLDARFADGVFVAPLASVSSSQFLVPAVAQALRLQFQGSAEPIGQLITYLRERRLLLVLENFDQLPGADRSGPALINRLLEQAPGVRLLVTARERLGLAGESVLELRGLAVPVEQAAPMEPAEADAYSAVQLFLQGARRVAPDFALTPANRAAVLRICQLVDGLPLGLELAAAWAGLLDSQEIAAQIERNLDFLGPIRAGAPDQPHSARAVLDYFWGLLSPDEQRVLRQLAVLRGSFPREAAAAVAGASFFFLAALVDRAFLTRTPAGRYQPHELLRRYAADQLAQAPAEQAAARARHAGYYQALAEQAEPELTGAHQSEWLDRLEQENDNLRAALEWLLSDEAQAADGGPALRLALPLWRFWWVRGYFSEGRRWLARALDQQPPDVPARRARAWQRLGILARGQGELALARQQLEAGLALFEQIGDRVGAGDVHNSLGLLALNQDDLVNARLNFERSLALERETGDRQRLAISLNNLGGVALQQSDLPAARALFSESLALRRAVGDQWGIANSLLNLSEAAYEQGDHAEALALAGESLTLRRELGDQPGLALCLEAAARAWAALGRPQVAAVLLGGAERLRETIGAPVPPSARRIYQQALAAAQAALGEEVFAATRAGGRSLSPAQLAGQALAKERV